MAKTFIVSQMVVFFMVIYHGTIRKKITFDQFKKRHGTWSPLTPWIFTAKSASKIRAAWKTFVCLSYLGFGRHFSGENSVKTSGWHFPFKKWSLSQQLLRCVKGSMLQEQTFIRAIASWGGGYKSNCSITNIKVFFLTPTQKFPNLLKENPHKNGHKKQHECSPENK